MDKRLNVHGLFRFIFFLFWVSFVRFSCVFRLSHLLMKWNFWFPPFTNLITSISTRTLLHTVVGRVECVELQYILVWLCCDVLYRALWPCRGQTRWLLYMFRHIQTAFCLGTCTGYITSSICLLRYCFECAPAIHTRTICGMSNIYWPHIFSECIGLSALSFVCFVVGLLWYSNDTFNHLRGKRSVSKKQNVNFLQFNLKDKCSRDQWPVSFAPEQLASEIPEKRIDERNANRCLSPRKPLEFSYSKFFSLSTRRRQ